MINIHYKDKGVYKVKNCKDWFEAKSLYRIYKSQYEEVYVFENGDFIDECEL